MKSMSLLKNTIFTLLFCLSISAQQSDEKAITIANKVVDAMGGMENYNNTRFIKWDFGKRILFWDKWNGNVRVESPKDSIVILININTLEGKVFEKDKLLDERSAKKWLKKGKNWWINDSYWLVMPWKLQDPGVTLKHIKTEKLEKGNMADVLQLTFSEVGVTPDNKYYVYVDQTDHLIKQWAFFKNFEDPEPKFIHPWDNYQKTGDILLSFDRSKFGPKNVVVKQGFNEKLFTDLVYE
ncbi:hypothetical protein H7U19_15490 [Hyunsoonleella sp. SJ7]|uniref:Outer membrane lipoprotein-sorting protein n=1 Tax=Hyunsoonleella aquatilis TaxID=2762758 RepID=A0A923KH67_9FLAO|nr:hypothetical protein [Hyunsoonleella aquatilis]MBC3759816.1 hypothetical protein [Hyunsoonleella aquatilis]